MSPPSPSPTPGTASRSHAAWDRRARSAPDVLDRDGFTLRHGRNHDGDPAGHLLLLEALDGAGHVSQRRVAEQLGMATSRVNRIIRELLGRGVVRVVDEAVRPFAYTLTEAGRRYLRELSYQDYAEVAARYWQVQGRIGRRLAELRAEGLERVVCYGAGEMLELVRPLAESHGLHVVGVVDDDPARQGSRDGLEVRPPDSLEGAEADAVVITTFRHAGEIRGRLVEVPGSMKVIEL